MSQSLNDRLEAFFRSRPNEWIDGKWLANIAGGYGWRSRCSDLRRQRGMTIENRQQVRRDRLTETKWTESYYRYVPEDVTVSGEIKFKTEGDYILDSLDE
jgi:hypothetical protein